MNIKLSYVSLFFLLSLVPILLSGNQTPIATISQLRTPTYTLWSLFIQLWIIFPLAREAGNGNQKDTPTLSHRFHRWAMQYP